MYYAIQPEKAEGLNKTEDMVVVNLYTMVMYAGRHLFECSSIPVFIHVFI